jgi:hypothetical protein
MISNRRKNFDTDEDFYPTPKWATISLMNNETFLGKVWEPACGMGHMSEVIKKYNECYSSDLIDRGYGEVVDFLSPSLSTKYDNIITNPPYNLALEFIERSAKLSNKKYAFLLRIAFLESKKRYDKLYSINPPSTIWMFSNRITFYPYGKEEKSSGTTAYAWFVWDNEKEEKKTEIKWIPSNYNEKIENCM